MVGSAANYRTMGPPRTPSPRSPTSPRQYDKYGQSLSRLAKAQAAEDAWRQAKQEAENAMAAGTQAEQDLSDNVAERKYGNMYARVTQQEIAQVHPRKLRRVQLLVKNKVKDKHKLLHEAFKHVDKDRTGTITREELNFFMFEELNLTNVLPAEFEALLDLMDLNHDGVIRFTEFATALSVDEHEKAIGLALAHQIDLDKSALRQDLQVQLPT